MKNTRIRNRVGGIGERMRGPLGVVLVWAVTRAALMVFVFQVVRFPGQFVVHDVEDVYRRWYPQLRAGVFPSHDVTWQYPPGAAAVLVAPAVLPFLGYAAAFYWLALLTDALVTAVFLAGSRGNGRLAGAWTWVLGAAAAGPVVFSRYDVMVTAVGVCALLALRRGGRAAGVLAGAGAMLKVWPALLLIGTARGPVTRRAWRWAAGTAGAVGAAFAATMPGAFSFLTFQRDRGTEIESMGAMVFHLARHAGWPGRATMHYGSVEFLGPHVRLVSWAALALSAAALCWLVVWRLRATVFTEATAYDAAFTAVLVFTTTSRVISPQYMIWLIGIGAVCRTVRGSVLRLPVLLTLAATVVTTAEFPVFFSHVMASDRWGVLLLGTRNALLAAACVIACRRLWAATVRRDSPAGPVQRLPDTPTATASVLTSR
ncbi:glycosyltransferase 87 family protein [Streptomyces sp. HPF1205]|uniref:glycosyltransferase 87 family protein n=1 Tax=Streptomyces sp. HPF1205 TaxID=2873262 RepID=UPI001CEC7419|nr:glycosyltransferase 87 family protein [Streptomyces sp. HPF1205]